MIDDTLAPHDPAGAFDDTTPHHRRLQSRHVRRTARGLGWFSLGLGLAEVLMPHAVARAAGLRGREGLVRACGLREIATGIGLLMARDPTPWLWARVAGDAVDLATLGAHAAGGHPHAANARLAIAAVAGVAAVDVAGAIAAQRGAAHDDAAPDYSDRRGMPLPPDEMRGVAMIDFDMPEDMQIPLPLRPNLH